MYGWLDSGVVQMKNGADGADAYPSESPLRRVYALGGGGDERQGRFNASVDLRWASEEEGGGELRAPQHWLLSSAAAGAAASDGTSPSGLLEVFAGGVAKRALDAWGPSNATAAASSPTVQSWSYAVQVAVNDADFPAGGLPVEPRAMTRSDAHALVAGPLGTSAACLVTTPNGVAPGAPAEGHCATSIAQPERGYWPLTNFFDPDFFFSGSAILGAGEPYLNELVRRVIEHSGAHIDKASGQLPHHFNALEPVFTAISGEIQTGPNLFFMRTCLAYARATQDLEWLRSYMPTIRLAASFLDGSVDPHVGLANVSGSLMVDVFLRSNFTSDTNAALVGLYDELADAEEALGNATGAATLRGNAAIMAAAMNRHLWLGDHYATQWNGGSSTRDFVDYDANSIAVAFGVANETRSKSILERISSGNPCPAAPTWQSERYYGPHDTTGGNIGDSWCAMGRTAWFDYWARRRHGDARGAEAAILAPLRAALEETTWMRERLSCDGSQQTNRTSGYSEYPSVVPMLLRAGKFGIVPSFAGLSVAPAEGTAPFEYHVGTLGISFYPEDYVAVTISLPGGAAQSLRFSFAALPPHTTYDVVLLGACLRPGSERAGELRLLPAAMSPAAPRRAVAAAAKATKATPHQATSNAAGELALDVARTGVGECELRLEPAQSVARHEAAYGQVV